MKWSSIHKRLAMLKGTSQQYTDVISVNTDTEYFAALYFTYL